MKIVIASLFALIASVSAFAHGGDRPFEYGYQKGNSPIVCQDGDQYTTREANKNGNGRGDTLVTYTCKDGIWVNPYAAAVAAPTFTACTEGQEQVISVETANDKTVNKLFICTNGKYVLEF